MGDGPRFCGTEILSAGRLRSLTPAATSPLSSYTTRSIQRNQSVRVLAISLAPPSRVGVAVSGDGTHHLNMGAQKKTVLGPASWGDVGEHSGGRDWGDWDRPAGWLKKAESLETATGAAWDAMARD